MDDVSHHVAFSGTHHGGMSFVVKVDVGNPQQLRKLLRSHDVRDVMVLRIEPESRVAEPALQKEVDGELLMELQREIFRNNLPIIRDLPNRELHRT